MTLDHHIKTYLCPAVQYGAASTTCANATKLGSGTRCHRAVSVGCCRAGMHAAVCLLRLGARAGMVPGFWPSLQSSKLSKNLMELRKQAFTVSLSFISP